MERELRSIPLVELRFDERTVRGVVMPYGKPGRHPSGMMERFEPGALRWWSVTLNVGHLPEDKVASTDDGTLKLEESEDAVTMEATTDRADELKRRMEAGELRGLSVEFRCLADVKSDGERRIVAAVLDGIGIVRNPAYQDASVEVRNRRHVWL